MRAIAKLSMGGGYGLEKAHSRPPQSAVEATRRWHGFKNKACVLQLLLEEQHQLCCYSELRADEEGLGYHIEHVENKSRNPQRTFDYANLAASALDSRAGLRSLSAKGEGLFGGHSPGKQSDCDMARLVSCFQLDCSRYFAYLSDGRVIPSVILNATDQDRAQYTIDLLNLNSPFLVTRRRQWWNELDELFQDHLNKNWCLESLAALDLVPSQRKLSRFFSITRLFFGPVAEKVLRDQAPELA